MRYPQHPRVGTGASAPKKGAAGRQTTAAGGTQYCDANDTTRGCHRASGVWRGRDRRLVTLSYGSLAAIAHSCATHGGRVGR